MNESMRATIARPVQCSVIKCHKIISMNEGNNDEEFMPTIGLSCDKSLCAEEGGEVVAVRRLRYIEVWRLAMPELPTY